MGRHSERRWGIGGPQVIAAAKDAAWRRAEERRAQEAEAYQPPCVEDDDQSVEVYREYAPGGTVSWGDTPCRYAGHPMHVCSDAYGGRVRSGTLCHAEARARLYERQGDLAANRRMTVSTKTDRTLGIVANAIGYEMLRHDGRPVEEVDGTLTIRATAEERERCIAAARRVLDHLSTGGGGSDHLESGR